MAANVLDILAERGFIEQTTDPEELKAPSRNPSPATSASTRRRRASTRAAWCPSWRSPTCSAPATGPSPSWAGAPRMIGDPSGKTEMRKMLTVEQIEDERPGA